MRNRCFWLCAGALALGACAADTAGTNSPDRMTGAGGSVAGGAGTPVAPAAKIASPSAGGSSAVSTAGTGGAPKPIAGAGGGPVVAAGGGGAGGAAGGTGGAAAPIVFATEPVIPEVVGDCPMFVVGQATFAGHSGVQILQAGPKSEGTGYLVFYWHGTGSSPAEASGNLPSEMVSEINASGGAVIGFSSQTGKGGDCSGTGTHSVGDFDVADQIVACGVRDQGINPKRIYATGCSAGGLQTGCMAIMRSNYIAAVAPNSGGVTIGYGPIEDKTRMPAVMTMHGAPGADVVIVDFSETSAAFDNFMLRNGSFAIDCNHGGGHCGTPGALYSSAWQFMKDHEFGTHPSPYAKGLPSGFHESCKIWEDTGTDPLGGAGM